MPTIAALVTDPAARRLAAEQIGGRAAVHFCESIQDLSELIALGTADVAVADLQDATGASVVATFGALRREVPDIPLIIFCPATPAALREVPDIVALGRRLDLVFQGKDHLGLALKPFLEPLRVSRPGEMLARHIVPLAPTPFRPFIAVIALKASPRLRVGTAATWSGVSRRTLERSLQHAGLPSAAVLLGSCTALHVAWWLDVQGWSVKHVVTEMGFSHKSGLNRVLRRYLNCSTRSLPEEGGFQGLLARFEAALVAR
jgi:AraC-like DNA-binding protein